MYGYKTVYFNFQKLLTILKLKKADGSYQKEIKNIEKQGLLKTRKGRVPRTLVRGYLLLDDFGLEKLDTISRLMFLEILEGRHGIKSTIVTSQLPVSSCTMVSEILQYLMQYVIELYTTLTE